MADIYLAKGGTGVLNYMWHEGDWPQYEFPISERHLAGTAPYDAHVDGAYGSGLAYFTLGMPFAPSIMPVQKQALLDKKPQPGDKIWLIVVPFDHYVKFVDIKIAGVDPNLAGACVQLVGGKAVERKYGEATIEDFPDVTNAFLAQGGAPIELDKPYHGMVSLMQSVGGFIFPMYSSPFIPSGRKDTPPTPGEAIVLGFEIVSLPTDPNVGLWDMRNGLYLSAKIEGFECPTNY